MDSKGVTLEGLRQQLVDLESAQRATGGTARPEFWSNPRPDAAGLGSSGASPDDDSATASGDAGVAAPPLTLDPSASTPAGAALTSRLTFAADITALPEVAPTALGEADLFASITALGRVQRHREVVLVKLMGDIEARGLPCPGGLGRVDWLRTQDPTLTATAAKAVVTCAVAFNEPRWQSLREAVTRPETTTTTTTTTTTALGDTAVTDPGTGDTAVTDPGTGDTAATDPGAGDPAAGTAGRVTVGHAALVIDFHTRLRPVADPGELDQAVTHLTDHASSLRQEDLARLARELSDQVRPPKNADDLDQKRRDARGLWFLGPNAAGMVGLTGTLDPEGAAILKAAIDPLSAPQPLLDDAGRKIEDDPRPAHQRRMDALIEIVARGVTSPGAAPRTDKTKVVVTMGLDALRETVTHHFTTWFAAGWTATSNANTAAATGNANAGTGPRAGNGGGDRETDPCCLGDQDVQAGSRVRGSGSCLTGDVLSPATVRRMACDAAIIPLILGSESQPLDVGRQERLVTRPMRTLLWNRDQGCSFPGCSMRPDWTDAHHVKHWLYGGETAATNLALLCRRHHVYVHEHDLTATITETGVTWHTWQQWRTSFDTGPPDPSDVCESPSAGDGHEVLV